MWDTFRAGFRKPFAEGDNIQLDFMISGKVTEITELPPDKTNKMACAPSEDSDQPGHLPSLIRVFAVRSMGS